MDYLELAAESLKLDEGVEAHVYLCPAGHPTIGVGRNIGPKGPGIRQIEIDFMLDNDLMEYEEELTDLYKDWPDFTEVRKATLLNIRHQVGLAGLKAFKKMNIAINAGDWYTAGLELLDSEMGRDPQLRPRTVRRMRELQGG